MKLRARLLALTIGTLLPLSALVVMAERRAQTSAAFATLRAHVEARLAGDGAQRCEDDPVRFSAERGPKPPRPGGPDRDGPPIQGDDHRPPWARDHDRGPHGRDHDGPPFRGVGDHGRERGPMGPPPGHVTVYVYDEEGRSPSTNAPPLPPEVRRDLGRSLERTFAAQDATGAELVVRIGPAGHRCAFLLARRNAPGFHLDMLRPWVPPVFVLAAAVLVGLIPVVRRIRRLARAVRASAGMGYLGAIERDGDDEIGDLARAFEEAGREVRKRIEAQAAREQALRDFLANTTHDVMTPLTALHGHLVAFRTAAAEGQAPDEAGLSAAIDEAHYMAALLHNLGVAARLEGGEPELVLAPVDLGRLVERVVSRHRIVATQHGLSLEHAVPDAPLLVEGDETFLEQAVSNFVYNALRYNKPGGHVAVVVDRTTDRFRIRVLDDGPGIPASRIEQVAQRSVRGKDARTRHPDGQGLGLAIAAKVAEIHGFDLLFENPEEGGLSVTLSGPIPATGTP